LPWASGCQIFPVVLGIDHHRERIERDRQLDVFDIVLFAVIALLDRNRARGVGNVGFAAAELLEAAAGAADADGYLDALVGLLKFLGHGFGDREYGR